MIKFVALHQNGSEFTYALVFCDEFSRFMFEFASPWKSNVP